MSQRRMFTLQIVDTDAFLDMPATSQLLYFHLAMRADDDGFVDKPKKIMREVGVNDDDMKVLLTKRFILAFESGIIVIKHWKMHNYIQSDRYHETKYLEEKRKLRVKENGAYTECIQPVSKMETEVRLELGKDRLGKDRLEGESAATAATPRQEFLEFLKSPESQIQKLIAARGQIYEPFIRREVESFISHWTERTASGKKQRWEMEKTFELNRRIATWFRNADKWEKDDKPQEIIKI